MFDDTGYRRVLSALILLLGLADEMTCDATTSSNSKYNFVMPEVDDAAGQHTCNTDVENLHPVNIDHLTKGVVNVCKILWVTVIAPCFRMSGLHNLVKDDTGRTFPT